MIRAVGRRHLLARPFRLRGPHIEAAEPDRAGAEKAVTTIASLFQTA